MDSRAGIPECGLQLVFVAPTPLSPPLSCAPHAKEGGAWLHTVQQERLVRKGRVRARQQLRHQEPPGWICGTSEHSLGILGSTWSGELGRGGEAGFTA